MPTGSASFLFERFGLTSDGIEKAARRGDCAAVVVNERLRPRHRPGHDQIPWRGRWIPTPASSDATGSDAHRLSASWMGGGESGRRDLAGDDRWIDGFPRPVDRRPATIGAIGVSIS